MRSKVLVPDYFEEFSCKCGACRHPCCDGWGINVAEHEYFKLLGIDCSIRLRHKLDDAFVISKQATPEAYAHIQPNYLEQCPMLDDDGLCLLQKEKGEDVMPMICRVYPRAVKKYGDRHEICMSCSCEETVELLMKMKTPLSLHETELDLPFDGMAVYGAEPEKDRIRHALLSLMSESSLPIEKRLLAVGELVCGKRAKEEKGDRAAALSSLKKLFLLLMKGSNSLRLCGEKTADYLGEADGEELLARFDLAEDRFYRLFPEAESFAGRVIANHMLYESFPFVPDCENEDTAFAAFCTAVALLKMLCVCGMTESEDPRDLADILAFANRFTEHSDFYRVCSRVDHPGGMETYRKFAPMLKRK